MEDLFNSQLAKVMYNACRDEMIDSPVEDEVVAAQRTRLCYHRFYRLYTQNVQKVVMPGEYSKSLEQRGSK